MTIDSFHSAPPVSAAVTSPIVVALDYPSSEGALATARLLDPASCRVKVGKELFTAAGPSVIEQLHGLGFDVFLDLKFHDIPNTCAKAVAAAADLGVWMVNVHASGGRRMMEAARNELDKRSNPPLLIGVTVLTSMDGSDLAELGLTVTPEQQVARLASLAQSSGLDGVVCSANELAVIRQHCGAEFKTVTPGIRPSWSMNQDQKRVMTPEQAMAAGVDYLVIGRPITQAENPAAACQKILDSLA
ncbi:orotidine-5'-phosphate decarboxylase [Oceanobacter sp. 5_MG-2023]|uniref:orotidine-5'-phosphate decarboxylase n=1 Tax=Oceanobacter sp. 5_MG-2023 TaxID=3062645 RepID=UPI0026E21130|nr:orotidine-5'-phosphate decarboxylase [Oceanobacter sp. 5_MG-2023]MDO6682980.1 orotidine-5'-phosphate decarboxylase [Oceanobacter sp. 5_MG-2023]